MIFCCGLCYNLNMKLSIRKWELSDAPQLAEVVNNKNLQNNLRDGLPFPYTQKDAEWFINEMLKSDPNSAFAFAIVCDDKVIGSVGIFRQQNIHNRTGELGYYLHEDFWGKGLMTEAVTQICKYVFENTDIIRIFAEPFAYNIGSCRVLEKSGFQFEGTLRANAVKNGKVLDMKMYSVLKDEFFNKTLS